MSNSNRIPNQNFANGPESRLALHRAAQDHKHGPESNHDHEENREQNRTLVGALGSGLASQAKSAVASKASSFLKNNLIGLIAPIRMTISNIELIPGVGGVIKTCENWFANNLQKYIERTGMKMDMSVDQAIDKLLRGDINEFSDEFADTMYNFATNAIPSQVTEAFKSGNPIKIVSALTSTISENASSLAKQMNNPEIKGNFLTRPLRYIASFIPFVNKAPEWLKPVIGGGVAYMGLGFVWRMAKGMFKWIVGGAALFLGYKFFFGKKVEPDQKAQLAAATKNPPRNSKSYAVPA